MSGGEEPRNAVERRAEVVAVALLGCASVQRHAHAYGSKLLVPCFVLERTLGSERGLHRLRRRGEGGVERIADGLEDMSTMPLNRLPQDGIIPREGALHRRAVLLP